jgi:hypothetical protein
MFKRRELLGLMGTSTAGLAILSAVSEASGDNQAPAHDPKQSAMLKECEEACGHCEATCQATFHHCLTQAAASKPEHAKMAQIVADCAEFCDLSAVMIARHSSLMLVSCHACAEACGRCAQACKAFATDDMMKSCFEACRRCEESCRNMVRHMGGEHRHQGGSEQPNEKH